VYAIGECALHRDGVYGLVAPGYAMADTLAARLCGEPREFTGADLSTALKLLGVDVASFGDPFADETRRRRARACSRTRGAACTRSSCSRTRPARWSAGSSSATRRASRRCARAAARASP
jgi:hypothetical protein